MSHPTPQPAKSGTSLVRLGVIVLALLAVGGAVYLFIQEKIRDSGVPPSQTNFRATFQEFLFRHEKGLKLADGYTDADGDLLADPPTAAKSVVNPDLLTFSAVASDDLENTAAAWKPFVEHLAKTTGKQVVYLKVEPGMDLQAGGAQGAAPQARLAGAKPRSNDEARQAKAAAEGASLMWSADQQLAAMRAGELHVTAFNTGMVPVAVTQAGFHPLYAPATADGKYAYEMRMIVPAGSSIAKPQDVKGKTLALAGLSSHSGGKLPLALLKDKFGLAPGIDYQVTFTGDHRKSVKEVADKKQAAACVAGDLLDQMVAAGEVKADAVNTVFASPSFCPLAFGVANTLDPKLRADVQKAFDTFAFPGTSVGKLYEPQKRTKFARIDYKKDFADVREVDAKLGAVLPKK